MKTALILGGGGARGSYEIGVWKALRELKINIDIVAGTSVGAINGAIIAQGDYDKALKLWLSMKNSLVFDGIKEDDKFNLEFLVNKVLNNEEINMEPLRKLLEETIEEKRIRNSSIELGIVTIEKDCHKPREVFIEEIEKDKLIDYIMASACLYPLVKPQDINGKKYMDGGIYDNLPVNMALKHGAEKIIAVDLKAIGMVKENVIEEVKNLIRISPNWDLGSIIEFDHYQIKKNIEIGYADAMKAFKVLDGYKYTFIKGEDRWIEKACYEFMAKIYSLIDKNFLEEMFPDIEEIKTLNKNFNEFLGHGIEEKDFALKCGEKAGEIFEVDFTLVYTFNTFKSHLKKEIEPIKEYLDITLYKDGDIDSMEMMKQLKNLLDKKIRTLVIATLMKDIIKYNDNISHGILNKTIIGKKFIMRLLSMMNDEFKAALFLTSSHSV